MLQYIPSECLDRWIGNNVLMKQWPYTTFSSKSALELTCPVYASCFWECYKVGQSKQHIIMSGWKLRYSDYRGFDIPRCYYCRCHYLKSALLFLLYFWSLIFLDPEHQRATGNLKYFEFQLEKQKKAAADEPPKKEEREKRDVTEKKKKPKKKPTFQLIPERKKYEMLCRGEGIRMVRERGRDTQIRNFYFTKTHLGFSSFVFYFPFLSLRPPAGRAGCSVVTMTTTTTHILCCHPSNSRMSGTALTLSATSTSSPTVKSRGSSNWQSQG